MAGVEVGEVGPKIGDNGTETGFCRLRDVRIPRDWMLMKVRA
jgi:alkylation response protein AidB-like acyl-CoA dehydrogenase